MVWQATEMSNESNQEASIKVTVTHVDLADKKHNRYAIRQQCADGRRAGQDDRVVAGRV